MNFRRVMETRSIAKGTHSQMDNVRPVRSTPIPPLARVSAALREVTEILAHELARPTERPPPWGDFEWRIARAVTAMQGTSSILCGALRWSEPASWRRFLQEQRDHVAVRHQRIVRLLDGIDLQARDCGVPLVALKGAALHRSGIYTAGQRPMADVDLLVRDDDKEQITRLLNNSGFEVTFTTWRHQLFESRRRDSKAVGGLGEHADSPVKIELHTSVRERLPVREIDITKFVFPYDAHPGVNDYASKAALIMHLLLHAAGNMRAHALRLIQLHDIALLAPQLAASDWEELANARIDDQVLWWAATPLILTARYYPEAIPANVIARMESDCPWLLRKLVRGRRLSEVSWSNIRVPAFPGIEWSQTLGEALTFMASRVWPSHQARSELRRFAAHHPGADSIPWYGVSQASRMLRWAFSRPPRVQCLLAVLAALDQPL